ncbi:MAG: aldolase [Phycisphaerales bacterium]|nr:aldolase [Phycisphaerales bacterium]
MPNPAAAPRLNRLLAADGRCFDVAIDHGFFNEAGFLSGIEDMRRAIGTIIAAAPDAIQLSPGMAPHLQHRPGAKPALVLRTDVANVYGRPLPAALFSRLIEDPVGAAVRLDAACVVVNILLLPGQPAVHERCVENVSRLRAECDRFGMPLMVEPLVMKGANADGYGVDGDAAKIIPLVRQAVELGADIIKADPTDDVSIYHRVIETAAGVPVLVRGGGKASEEEVFRRTHALMEQGASGIVYGRNVIQHANPAGITRALMAIVHEGATPERAMQILNGG